MSDIEVSETECQLQSVRCKMPLVEVTKTKVLKVKVLGVKVPKVGDLTYVTLHVIKICDNS